MAKRNDTEMVWAHGDNGLELTAEDDVVEIRVMPMGPGNTCIPASLRFTHRSGGVPTRILKIEPMEKNGHRGAYIHFECTPYPLGQGDRTTPLGWVCGCCVFNEQQATDPLFDGLTEHERTRILRSVTRLRSV